MTEYKHAELTKEILAAAFEVHRALGPGFLEKIYHNALIYELIVRGHSVQSEVHIPVMYKDIRVGEHVLDLIVNDQVIVELKSVNDLAEIHSATVLSYLAATRLEVALLLNFRKISLEVKRLVR